MSATIRNVAKLAAVNPFTVSRVINSKAVITAEIHKKVYNAMGQFDYHSNFQVQILASGQVGTIGLVMHAGGSAAFNNAFSPSASMPSSRRRRSMAIIF